jgi:probable HAF family extracellular repeat protein
MKVIRTTGWKVNRRYGSLAIALSFSLLSSLAVAADYHVVDLGANVSPKDINTYGIIAGARNTDQYPNIAFRWTPGAGFEDLNGTSANAINDAGKIAGSTITGAFVLDGNSMKSWDEHAAYGINEFGNVSGSQAGNNPYRTTSIPYNPAVLEGNRWTVMDIAKVYPRGTRQGVYADIYTMMDINDSGYTVGLRRRYGLAGSSAILIAPPYSSIKDLTDVIYLPTGGVANAINDENLIVGQSANDSRTDLYATAFLYDGVDVNFLGTLGGGLRSGANDINNFAEIVGYSETSSGNHAFVWDAVAGMRDLNDLIAATGWVLSSTAAINEAGDIVGIGTLDGQSHGFLLTTNLPPEIPNQQPVAFASSNVSSGKAPLPVLFSSDGSADPDGTIVSYAWDFGDGTGSSEANPGHTYDTTGTYIAQLTVTDDGGMTDTAVLDITVRKSKGKSGK